MTAAGPRSWPPVIRPRVAGAGLGAWTLVWIGAYAAQGGTSWFFFENGSRWLFDPDGAVGGLDLYVGHPEIQIGPLSLLASAPFVAIGGAVGRWAAIASLLGLGAVVVHTLARLAVAVRGRVDVTAIACLAAVVPVWSQLAVGAAHLDDAIAMSCAVVAVWLLHRDRGRATSLLVALLCAAAIDCKPWALGFAALLAVVPRQHLLPALGVLVGATAVAWAPFVLHDWSTWDALRYEIKNSPFSALRALGVDSPHTPAWCRTTQLVAGVTLGLLAAVRGRPALVPAVVVAARLLLDPGAHMYYNAGLVVAAAVADLAIARWRVPWFTTGAVACFVLPEVIGRRIPGAAPAVGDLRAAYLLVLLGTAVWLCARRPVRTS